MVKRLNKIKTFICALAFVVCLAMTTTAYADWGGFGSSGGRGGWAQGDGTQSSYPLAKSLHWFEGNSKTCPKVMENMGWRKDLNLIFAYLTPGRGTCDDPPPIIVFGTKFYLSGTSGKVALDHTLVQMVVSILLHRD